MTLNPVKTDAEAQESLMDKFQNYCRMQECKDDFWQNSLVIGLVHKGTPYITSTP